MCNKHKGLSKKSKKSLTAPLQPLPGCDKNQTNHTEKEIKQQATDKDLHHVPKIQHEYLWQPTTNVHYLKIVLCLHNKKSRLLFWPKAEEQLQKSLPRFTDSKTQAKTEFQNQLHYTYCLR